MSEEQLDNLSLVGITQKASYALALAVHNSRAYGALTIEIQDEEEEPFALVTVLTKANSGFPTYGEKLKALVEEAQEKSEQGTVREACARVADQVATRCRALDQDDETNVAAAETAEDIAAAIRAGGGGDRG